MRKRISMYQSLYTLFNYILPIKINPLPTHFRFLDLDVIHLNRQITLQAYSSGRGRLTHVSSGIKIGSTNIDSFYRTCSHICHSFLVLVPFKSRDLLSLGPPQKLCIEQADGGLSFERLKRVHLCLSIFSLGYQQRCLFVSQHLVNLHLLQSDLNFECNSVIFYLNFSFLEFLQQFAFHLTTTIHLHPLCIS